MSKKVLILSGSPLRRFLERVLKQNGASRSMMSSMGISNNRITAKVRI